MRVFDYNCVMSLKVLFVDWDGTLSNSKFWEQGNSPKLDPVIVTEFTTFLFRDSKELIKAWMRGDVTSRDISDLIASQYDLEPAVVYHELELSCRRMRLIDASTPDKISRIRRNGTKTVIATDNMDTFMKWTVPALKLESIFDGVLDSPTNGALKADITEGSSQFFGHYFQQQGVKAEETALIDDNLENAIVESFGMKFIHVNETNSLGAILDSLTQE